MTIQEMEPRIIAFGLKILEARLYRQGRVHWIICADSDKELTNLVVYAEDGKAFLLPNYRLPNNVSEIKLERSQIGPDQWNIFIDGRNPFRDERFDIVRKEN